MTVVEEPYDKNFVKKIEKIKKRNLKRGNKKNCYQRPMEIVFLKISEKSLLK